MTATAPSVAVVLHDVAPATWQACQRVRRCVQALAPAGTTLPMTLLVVPRYHAADGPVPALAPPAPPTPADLAFEHGVSAAAAQGDELALHGYTHLDDGRPRGWIDHLRRRWYTAGEGEFSALTEAQAAERLALGRQWFAARGWPVRGFVAPAWLVSDGSWQALAHAGFDYTCTLSQLVALPQRRALQSQSIVYSTRAAWRRALSVVWNASVARRERDRPLLRFELHPSDADHPRIRDAWMDLLADALRHRQPLTLARAAELLCGAGRAAQH